MSIFNNPVPQLLDDNGDPLSGAKISFFETGTSTLKTVYADSNFTIAQSNPVIADANGRITDDVYLDGLYRVVGQTAEGVNIDGWDKDPVGDIDSGQFGDWSNDATYDENDIVQGSDGEYYKALTGVNQGNDPTTDATNWAILNLQTLTEATAGNIYYGGASSAGTDAYAATLSASPVAYATGQRFQWFADVANVGACTVNFNAIGDESIKMPDGSDPFDGAIPANSIPDVEYDGTNFILQNAYYKAEYVDDNSTQFVGGIKKFTAPPVFQGAVANIQIQDTDNTIVQAAMQSYIQLIDSASADAGSMGFSSASENTLIIKNNILNEDVNLTVNGAGTGNITANGSPIWDDSGSNGPTAVSGYTKDGSGIYHETSGTLSYSNLTFNSLTALAVPSGATGVILDVKMLIFTSNGIADRSVTLEVYSNSGGTNVIEQIKHSAREEVAVATTSLARTTATPFAPAVSGNVYVKYSAQDAGADGLVQVRISGYTV